MEEKRCYTVKELQEILGISRPTVYELLKRNEFRWIQIGTKYRISKKSFDDWLDKKMEQYRVSKDPALQKTMSVPEMRKLLGLKKTSYSFQEAANLLGVNNANLYEIWKREKRKTITVDFVMRIPKEEFEKWYEQQDVYKKADKMPTISDMERDYIRFEEAAMLLDVMESEMLKLIRTSEYRNLFDIRIFNNKKWISRKSFQLFLNAQNEYRINKEDNETVADDMIAETKQYISRQEAAELAGVTASTITKWMQMKKFTCMGAGKVLRIHRMEFLKWLDENREGVC